MPSVRDIGQGGRELRRIDDRRTETRHDETRRGVGDAGVEQHAKWYADISVYVFESQA